MELVLTLELRPGRSVFLGFIGFLFATLLLATAVCSSPVYADTPHCGPISTDQTWSSAGNAHTVDCDVTVESGVTLTVTQGTIVQFASAKKLTVNGTLVAVGTAGEPITMTAKTATPSAGYWQGLYFESDSTVRLEHVSIEYAGDYDYAPPTNNCVEIASSAVSLSHVTIRYCDSSIGASTGIYAGGDVTIDSSTISDCTGYGVHAAGAITLTNSVVNDNGDYPLRISAATIGASVFTGTSFAGNSPNAISAAGATLVGEHIWPPFFSQQPVHVDSLTVGSGGALTLSPGTALHFAATGGFQVDGTLTALGTASEPITMTAKTATPEAGFWQGLLFNDGSAGDLEHVTVEYGGAYDYGIEPPFNTGVEIHSSDVSLSNATILDSEGTGLYSTTSMSLTGCVINDSSGYPVRIPASVIGDSQITANSFSGNGVDALSVGGSTVTGNHTWPLWMAEYPVHIDSLAVGSGGALTLPAGISLHFPEGKAFNVDGTLTALGTESAPITMTANSTAPVPGFWQGLHFNSGSAGDLDHVTVEYGGYYDYGTEAPFETGVEIHSSDVSLTHATIADCEGIGVYASTNTSLVSSKVTGCSADGVRAGGVITLTDTVVSDNGGYPLRISGAAIGPSEFTGTTFSDNSPNAIFVIGAELVGSHSWPALFAEHPVHVDWLTVMSGADLTLPPGVGLYLAATKAFEVNGTLTARGTVTEPITMTARSATPTAGFWQGLYFNSGSAGDLDYVTVEYAGDYDYVPPTNNCVEIASNDVSLSHVTVRYCASSIGVSTGIYASGDVTIESSTVSDCTGYGVYAGGTIALTDSIINDNDDYPLRISAENISASEFTGTTFAGNSPDAVYAAGATLAGSHTWPAWLDQYPVHIGGNELKVGGGADLTLPPGIGLYFAATKAFEVDGILTARGTVGEPITMTARSATPAAGSWQGLYFNSGSAGDLDYVTVEYAGDYDYAPPTNNCVEIASNDVSLSHVTVRYCASSIGASTGIYAGGDITIESSTISDCTGYGVYAGGAITLTDSIINDNDDYPLRISAENISTSEFTGTTFAGNTPDAVYAAGATLAGSHTWPAWLAQYPVHIDWLKVGSGADLTLPPGVGLYFAATKAFEVDGALTARGTVSEPITMTARSATPTAGFWQGLYFNSGSAGDLDYVTVEYAGDYDHAPPTNNCVEIASNDVSLSHVTIRHCGSSIGVSTGIYAGGDITIESSTVFDCTGYGVYAGGTITLTDSIINDNDDYPLRISAENISASEFTGTTFAGNSPDAVYAAGATLAGSHTWPAWLAQYPVHIDWLKVGSGADLTLPPGIGLYFAATKAFEVDGILTARGTVGEPITMTARSAIPTAGFWQGLYFNGGSAGDLDYVTVEYAGDYDYAPPTNNCVEIASNDVSLSHVTVRYCASSIGVSTGIYAGGDVTVDGSLVTGCTGYGVHAGGTITLTDSIINDNDDYPLRIPAENISASEFTGTTFAGNSPDAVYAAGATLEGSHTWPAWLAQYPVHLHWLTVDSGAALTLPAGAALHLGEQEAFEVYGALLARGTPTMPITMTVNLSTPAAGSWQGLYLYPGSSGVLKHLTVEYAGDPDSDAPNNTGVEVHSSDVSVSNVTVQRNEGSGIYVKADTLLDHMLIQYNNPEGLRVANASVLVENSIIRDNSKGAFVRDANVTIVDSLIYHNSVYGVHNNTSTPPPVMATHNWWGDPSGPFHPDTNPGGLGDQVSDHVIYRPWRVVDARPLDLGILKTDEPDPVMVHTNLTYTLVISNTGPDAAPGVVMTDTLPASVTYASSTASQGSCNGTAPVVCTWDLITASESVTVTIVVTAEKVGPITNVVTMSTLAPDTHDGNNDVFEATLVVRNTDFSYIFLPLVLRR